MADETEYKGFGISLGLQGNGWTATIARRDGAPLLVNLPGSRNERRTQSLDTPPQDTAVQAMRLALDMIDDGGIV